MLGESWRIAVSGEFMGQGRVEARHGLCLTLIGALVEAPREMAAIGLGR